ncbi:MAG: CDP-alcohol phosphatidyltransferase family protein [Oceanococcus sp.]
MKKLAARELLNQRFDSPDQAFLTRRISQPLGRVVAAAAYKFHISPNALTYAGMIIGLMGSFAFAHASGGGGETLIVVLVLQLSFAFDCADGQLARATHRGSDYGAWLDIYCDFLRYVGLACAITFRLEQAAIDIEWRFLTLFAFVGGGTTYLYSVAVAGKQVVVNSKSTIQPTVARSRDFLTNLMDTPLLLLVLPLLQNHPTSLALYSLVYGAFLLVRGWAVGYRRLKKRY